jgi:hypothetical protein
MSPNGNGSGASLISHGTEGHRPDRPRPSSPPRTSAPLPADHGRASAVATARVDAVLADYRAQLEALPGVVDVRRGFKVTDGWISTTPCIVVTVLRKEARPAVPIPSQIDDVLIDIAPATPREQVMALSPAAKKSLSLDAAIGAEELIRTSRYVPPPHLRLKEVTAAMTVLCHTSPDAGWPTLRRFFDGITQRLTLGMYDFTAPHVRKQLLSSLRNVRGDLRLILDPNIALGAPGGGENPKADDETEDKLTEQLRAGLGSRFQFVWAAVKRAGKTTKGIFPSAYHIKVAVRDGLDFWLSSGNLQSTNQPDLDPLAPGADTKGILATYNREWHVVVAHRGLARTLEEFLEWDYEQAEPVQTQPELAALPQLALPAALELAEPEAAVADRFFKPKLFRFTHDAPLRVKPLLSPDNYAGAVLELVKSARRTLYIQNQYVKLAKENTEEFRALLDAIKDAIADGVDVRIIVRDLPDTRAQLEALQEDGFDMRSFKTLPNTHTKGVIVDSSVVMVGSHNWSNDGVVYNRDASLVFHDAGIAKFYEEVFLYDWSRARHKLRFDEAMPVVIGSEEAAPADHRVVGWADLYDGYDS